MAAPACEDIYRRVGVGATMPPVPYVSLNCVFELLVCPPGHMLTSPVIFLPVRGACSHGTRGVYVSWSVSGGILFGRNSTGGPVMYAGLSSPRSLTHVRHAQ